MLIGYQSILPNQLFDSSYSTVVYSKEGRLIGARIAKDEQWRFPQGDTVPQRFIDAITTFEDKRFYDHIGIDFISVARAIWQNITDKKISSGASTLTMQVIRLSRKGQARTFSEKIIEMILASRIEFEYSKDEILKLYSAHAPFGGNVVGLESASWKYFGRPAYRLSIAETATLAVLPNSPALIHPNRNRSLLKNKRDRLLNKLRLRKLISEEEYKLALLEHLPSRPLSIPNFAPHFTEQIKKQGIPLLHSTINYEMQLRTSKIINNHAKKLAQNGIDNAAAIIIDVETGDILSYVGNTTNSNRIDGHPVDIIKSKRSSGSILKPFLYAMLMNDGQILPKTLVPDIPSYFSNYTPKNFDYKNCGAIAANRAIAKSLNIPAVYMLEKYNYKKFHANLKRLGASTLTKSAEHYGLSIILGGAETSLWDLGRMYGGMARSLNHYTNNSSTYPDSPYHNLNFNFKTSSTSIKERLFAPLNASSIWFTFKALLDVKRPNEEYYWENFSSSRKIAWKTGTSFGFRDAWAVGITPKYIVAVWVGNADGEGRTGLIGSKAAAPILFDIFNSLPSDNSWFETPYDDMEEAHISLKSGYRCNPDCPDAVTDFIPLTGLKTKPCPYHKTYWLDSTSTYQVHSTCESPSNMVKETYFVLPPTQEYYYKKRNPNYTTVPSFREDCRMKKTEHLMSFIYPQQFSKIYIPINLNEEKSKVVFEATHRKKKTMLFWHLDNQYIGSTTMIHQMALAPSIGKHKITLVDEEGNYLRRTFEIIEE